MRDLTSLHRHALQVGIDGGAFRIPCKKTGKILSVIASTGGGWDHVSVTGPRRPPLWVEMEFVKRLFFNADETAFQLHVPPSDHVNCHPNCLHLWRPQAIEIPRPPSFMV